MSTFTIPAPFTNETPFTDMHLTQWAMHMNRKDVTITNYLKDLGFVLGRDKISEEDYDRLNIVVEAWHISTPHMRNKVGGFKLSELFEEAGKEWEGNFYFTGNGWPDDFKGRKMAPNATLLNGVIDAGWIYDVIPQTTYFEINNGYLFSKYQQIIGSRRLCKIIPE